eukprot:CAMPEP_0114520922 /NCGR_PEP_ID=MMETSP0109-20121206/19892_1 /TAXON_ID=29199 /ORGANISM="Chlorarachnion reptans, Strain CCCM449" /LENGTH=471 /DNA_ID=CAMNT_0001701955 /DNA_START=424 /DNA_END=1839 /DNA_ORIENTATION=-
MPKGTSRKRAAERGPATGGLCKKAERIKREARTKTTKMNNKRHKSEAERIEERRKRRAFRLDINKESTKQHAASSSSTSTSSASFPLPHFTRPKKRTEMNHKGNNDKKLKVLSSQVSNLDKSRFNRDKQTGNAKPGHSSEVRKKDRKKSGVSLAGKPIASIKSKSVLRTKGKTATKKRNKDVNALILKKLLSVPSSRSERSTSDPVDDDDSDKTDLEDSDRTDLDDDSDKTDLDDDSDKTDQMDVVGLVEDLHEEKIPPSEDNVLPEKDQLLPPTIPHDQIPPETELSVLVGRLTKAGRPSSYGTYRGVYPYGKKWKLICNRQVCKANRYLGLWESREAAVEAREKHNRKHHPEIYRNVDYSRIAALHSLPGVQKAELGTSSIPSVQFRGDATLEGRKRENLRRSPVQEIQVQRFPACNPEVGNNTPHFSFKYKLVCRHRGCGGKRFIGFYNSEELAKKARKRHYSIEHAA